MAKLEEIEVRQAAIKELIRRFPIENQDMLVTLLKKEFAIETTQSIISRDLREIQVSKKLVKDKMIYEITDTDITKEILQRGIISAKHNETMIVINTLPGMAAFVGDHLDKHKTAGVLGTLAGENVVFVVPNSIQEITIIFNKICALIHLKQTDLKD